MQRVTYDALDYDAAEGRYTLDGEPFTGVVYAGPEDEPQAEQAFRHGLRWGPCWERYESGQMCAQSTFYRDVLHGRAREWHENGQLAGERRVRVRHHPVGEEMGRGRGAGGGVHAHQGRRQLLPTPIVPPHLRQRPGC